MLPACRACSFFWTARTNIPESGINMSYGPSLKEAGARLVASQLRKGLFLVISRASSRSCPLFKAQAPLQGQAPDCCIRFPAATCSEPELMAWVRSFGDCAELADPTHKEENHEQNAQTELQPLRLSKYRSAAQSPGCPLSAWKGAEAVAAAAARKALPAGRTARGRLQGLRAHILHSGALRNCPKITWSHLELFIRF